MPLLPVHKFCHGIGFEFCRYAFSQSRFWIPCHGNGAAVSDPVYQPEKSQEVNQDSYKTRVKRYHYGEGFICGRDKKENPA
jgi:hypothetical protein